MLYLSHIVIHFIKFFSVLLIKMSGKPEIYVIKPDCIKKYKKLCKGFITNIVKNS